MKGFIDILQALVDLDLSYHCHPDAVDIKIGIKLLDQSGEQGPGWCVEICPSIHFDNCFDERGQWI